jgi:hypothetical protein
VPRRTKASVPAEIRAVFVRAVAEMSRGREPPLVVPDPLPVGARMHRLWDHAREQNYLLEFVCVKTAEGRFTLEYHWRSNDGQAWGRGRIHEDGREETTESHFAL